MKITTVVHFDRDTINNGKILEINNTNKNLKEIIKDYYSYVIDDATFMHALLLLGVNPNRFGYDLSHYLNSIQYILPKLTSSNYIKLDIGSSDFKRRASEDLGVGISSLFMVDSYNILWQKITQIPTNKKLSKFTPDFISLDNKGNIYI